MSIYNAIEKFDGKSKIVTIVYKFSPNMASGLKDDKGEYQNRFFENDKTPRIYKLSRMNGIIGTSYEKVTQNRNDYPEFQVSELWGGRGEHINKYLVKHVLNNKIYLAFLLNSVLKTGYFWNSGDSLDKKEVEELYLWMDKKRESNASSLN